MKTLILCRHAKSDWKAGLPDFERPLNKRGLRDAPKMGKTLADYGWSADLIVSSPAMRAKTTARLVGEALGYDPSLIQMEQTIYDHGHGAVYGLIQDLPQSAHQVMLFGHNPTMESLGEFLLQQRAGITFPTCGMLCLESHVSNWNMFGPSNVRLKWFLIPRLLE